MIRTRFMPIALACVLALVPGPTALAGRPSGPPKAALKPLPPPAAAGSIAPRLAAGEGGATWLSWIEPRTSGGGALRIAKLDDNRWSPPRTVADGDSLVGNWANVPQVIALGGTRLAAAWLWASGPDPEASEVRLALSSDDGRSWSAPVVPHRDGTATEHGFVSLLPAGDGVRAVWLDGRNFARPAGDSAAGAGHDEAHGGGAEMTLRTAVLHPGGALSDEALLDARVCDCCGTAIASASGAALVAYRDRGAAEVRDVAVVREEGERWSEPRPVHADGWTIHGCPVNGPALDAIGDRVVAAWYTAAADTPRVRVAFSEDGGRSFGPAASVDAGAPLGRVDVALLDDGAALVIWVEGDGPNASLRLRRVGRDGTPWLPVTIAQLSSSRASGFPRFVRSGSRIVFAWTEPGKPSHLRVAAAKL
jgi:hypothetical protein